MKYKNLEFGASEDYGLLINSQDVDDFSSEPTATDNESSSSRSSSRMSVCNLPPLQRLQSRDKFGSGRSTPSIESIAMKPVAQLDGWMTPSAREVIQLAREEVDRAAYIQSLPHRALELEREKAVEAESSKGISHVKSTSFFTVSPNLVNLIIPQEADKSSGHKYKRSDRASMVLTTVRPLPSPRLFRHEQAKAAQTSSDELVNLDTSNGI